MIFHHLQSWRWAYLRLTQTFKHCKLAPLNFPHRRFYGLYKEQALNWLISKENTTKRQFCLTLKEYGFGGTLNTHQHPRELLECKSSSVLLLSGLISTLWVLNLVEPTSGRWKMQISAPSHSETISTLFFVVCFIVVSCKNFFLFCLLTIIFLSYRL